MPPICGCYDSPWMCHLCKSHGEREATEMRPSLSRLKDVIPSDGSKQNIGLYLPRSRESNASSTSKWPGSRRETQSASCSKSQVQRQARVSLTSLSYQISAFTKVSCFHHGQSEPIKTHVYCGLIWPGSERRLNPFPFQTKKQMLVGVTGFFDQWRSGFTDKLLLT